MEDRARKVEELEKDIAQTIETQAKENSELAERIAGFEAGIKEFFGGDGSLTSLKVNVDSF